MNTRYPKILFVSQTPFSTTANNGKTYVSLLKQWPKSRIAQLYFNESETPDFNFCDNYYRITDKQVLNSIIKFNKNYSTNSIDQVTLNTISVSNKSYKDRFSLLLLRDLFWGVASLDTSHLYNWVKKFNPDVVFFVCGPSRFTYTIVNKIIRKFDLPLIVYFTDDYYINPRVDNPLKFLQYHLNTKPCIEKIIAKSNARLVIGEYMSRDYSTIFKRDFVPVMNSVELNKSIIADFTSDNMIKLVYMGGLHYRRWESLLKLNILIQQVCDRYSIMCKFDIFTTDILSEDIRLKLNTGVLNLKGAIDGSKVNDTLNCYHILVHVESEHIEARKATKYSISTKIPEYLSTGRCVLAYGPNEVASIRLISDYELGVILTDKESDEEKEERLSKLLSDDTLRAFYGRKGKVFAQQNFNNIKMQKKVKDLILNITQTSKIENE